MAALNAPTNYVSGQKTFSRRADRITCIITGGLAVIGGVLGLFVHPWLAGLAVVAGLWLILAPESKACTTKK